MGLNIPVNVIVAYGLGLLLLYVIGWLLLVPFKVIWKFIFNGILGGIVLWILNMVGKHIGVVIAINPVTAIIVGFLGIPGIILILLLQFILI
ncbi:pro-sigmaK processing inhibitor BofA family protein [Xylanivirga thermophila]|uniref:pro-sigmaK processing inhibitor BofA family protein n=1 Tax=Xylanivirga thermophila TaxID=2496273 RepID=UPI00101D2AB5|nr:pro-sigmaK processing inhibitor BofA family protein [Xylanivirga thermophila]